MGHLQRPIEASKAAVGSGKNCWQVVDELCPDEDFYLKLCFFFYKVNLVGPKIQNLIAY